MKDDNAAKLPIVQVLEKNLGRKRKKQATYNRHISEKFANEVFLVPTLNTCGGLMTKRFFSPATMSGFFSLMISKTLVSN